MSSSNSIEFLKGKIGRFNPSQIAFLLASMDMVKIDYSNSTTRSEATMRINSLLRLANLPLAF